MEIKETVKGMEPTTGATHESKLVLYTVEEISKWLEVELNIHEFNKTLQIWHMSLFLIHIGASPSCCFYEKEIKTFKLSFEILKTFSDKMEQKLHVKMLFLSQPDQVLFYRITNVNPEMLSYIQKEENKSSLEKPYKSMRRNNAIARLMNYIEPDAVDLGIMEFQRTGSLKVDHHLKEKEKQVMKSTPRVIRSVSWYMNGLILWTEWLQWNESNIEKIKTKTSVLESILLKIKEHFKSESKQTHFMNTLQAIVSWKTDMIVGVCDLNQDKESDQLLYDD